MHAGDPSSGAIRPGSGCSREDSRSFPPPPLRWIPGFRFPDSSTLAFLDRRRSVINLPVWLASPPGLRPDCAKAGVGARGLPVWIGRRGADRVRLTRCHRGRSQGGDRSMGRRFWLILVFLLWVPSAPSPARAQDGPGGPPGPDAAPAAPSELPPPGPLDLSPPADDPPPPAEAPTKAGVRRARPSKEAPA